MRYIPGGGGWVGLELKKKKTIGPLTQNVVVDQIEQRE